MIIIFKYKTTSKKDYLTG